MDGYANSQGTYRISITCPENAIDVLPLSCGTAVTGNTSSNAGPSGVGHPAPEHYFNFTAPYTGTYTFNSCGSGYDTYIHVYAGSSASGTHLLGRQVASCDDCGPCGVQSVLTARLSAGTSYYVIMDGFAYSSGAYRLIATCPSSNSPPPPSAGGLGCARTVTGSTVNGANTVGHRAPEMWYTFTATTTGQYSFNSCGSAYDTWIHIYSRGANNAQGGAVATCDDCGPCGTRTVLNNLNLAAGNYWVVMDGFGNSRGSYRLRVSCPGDPPPPPPTPLPTNPGSSGPIQGTVTCSQVATGNSATGSHSVGHSAPEHWWRFTAPQTGVYNFNSCGSSYDTYIHIFTRSTSSTSGNRRVSTCDDCGPCGTRTVLTSRLPAGNYWVVMDGFATSRGLYRLQITCPSGSGGSGGNSSFTQGTLTCGTAGQPGTAQTGNTAGGTSQVGHAAPEHYYNFTAQYTGVYTFNTCGSAYDTYVHIYAAAPQGSPALLGNQMASCDDCGPCGLRTVLTTQLQAGSYFIVVDGFSTRSGAYRITATCPSGNAPPPPVTGQATCGSVLTGNTNSGTHTVGHRARELWYTFTAPVSGRYVFSSCGSSYDTWIHIYARGTSNALGRLVGTCDDCGPCGTRTVLAGNLAAGSYFVVMDGFSNSQGTFRLQITCPGTGGGGGGGPPSPAPTVAGANGPWQGTVVCGQSVTGNSATGTQSVGHAAPEHWWRFTAPTQGTYTFSSCGSSYDTWVHIFMRNGNQPGRPLATCDDCGPCGTRTVLGVTLNPGQYYVVMDGFSTNRGNYRLQITCPQGAFTQGNLNCGSPVTGSTAGGTSGVGHGAPEHYFRFTAPYTGSYTFDSCGSSYDTYVHIFYQSSANSTSALGNLVATCDDCGPCGLRTVLTATLPAGNYYVVMDGFANSQGAYRLVVSCPTSDAPPPQASGTAQCNSVITGNSSTGTHLVGNSAPELWYIFTAPTTGNYTFNSCGSSYDTWIHVHSRLANNVIGGVVATCDDCGPCGTSTVMTVGLEAGNYYVIVDGWSNAQGLFRMSITCPGDPPPPPVPPAPIDRTNGVLACRAGNDYASCHSIGCCHWYGGSAGCRSTVGTRACPRPLCNGTDEHFVCQNTLCNSSHPFIESWQGCRDAAAAIGLADQNPCVVTVVQPGQQCTTDYYSSPCVYCSNDASSTPGGCYYKPNNAPYARLWYNAGGFRNTTDVSRINICSEAPVTTCDATNQMLVRLLFEGQGSQCSTLLAQSLGQGVPGADISPADLCPCLSGMQANIVDQIGCRMFGSATIASLFAECANTVGAWSRAPTMSPTNPPSPTPPPFNGGPNPTPPPFNGGPNPTPPPFNGGPNPTPPPFTPGQPTQAGSPTTPPVTQPPATANAAVAGSTDSSSNDLFIVVAIVAILILIALLVLVLVKYRQSQANALQAAQRGAFSNPMYGSATGPGATSPGANPMYAEATGPSAKSQDGYDGLHVKDEGKETSGYMDIPMAADGPNEGTGYMDVSPDADEDDI